MRAIRVAIAALIAMALAVLPMSAGLANPPSAHVEMSAGGPDDCPCCDMSHEPAAHICPLKCCGAAAILVEAQPLTGPRSKAGDDTVAAVLSSFSPLLDPPPPRA